MFFRALLNENFAVPDLAFSELAFLNTSRREPNGNTVKEDARGTRKVKSFLDKEAEISRYFSASNTKKQDNRENTLDDRHLIKHRKSKLHDSSPLMVDLPDKPFLGFGTSGANSVSPLMIVKELDARYVPPMPQRDTKSPSCSSGYLSWSLSGVPSSVLSNHARSHTKRFASKCHSRSAEKGNTSHNNLVLAGPPMEAAQPAPKPLPSEIEVSTARVLSEHQCSPRQDPTISQVGLREGQEVERVPVSQSPDSAAFLRTNVPAENIVVTPAAEMSGNLGAEAELEKRTVEPVTKPLGPTSRSQQVYDSIEHTINALLQACKDKLLDAAVKDDGAGPQNNNSKEPIVPLERLSPVKPIRSLKAPNRFNPLQIESRDDSPNVPPSSYQGRQDVSLAKTQCDNQSWETLPASMNGELRDGKPGPYSSQTMGVLHLQVPHASKPAISTKHPITGSDLLFERQQANLTNAPGEAKDSALEMDKRNPYQAGYGSHQWSSGSLIDRHSHADDENPEYEQSQYQLDNFMENQRPEHYQSWFDADNTNHGATYHPSFNTRPEMPTDRQFQITDPSIHYTGLHEHLYPQTFEAAQSNHFSEIDPLPHGNIHPEQAENPTNFPVASTAPLTRAWESHVFGVHEERRVHLEGFWKPNKLY